MGTIRDLEASGKGCEDARMKKKKKVPPEMQTYVVRSEFFEDRKIAFGPKTPAETFAVIRWLSNEKPADHTKEANVRLIERYRQEAQTETVNIEWAKKVEDRAQDLLAGINQAVISGSEKDIQWIVYEALLLQEAYLRMRLTRHEANASTGRKHRGGSSDGARKQAAQRKKDLEENALRVAAEANRMKGDDNIRGTLAERYDVTESTIDRWLRLASELASKKSTRTR
jgi:hypothetical protein